MKRAYIFCFILMGISISNTVSGQVAIGLKAGAQMTKLDSKWVFDDELETEWAFTPDFGAILNFGYENPVSFQMEINYSPKATKYHLLDEEIKQTNNYVDLPLLLKVKFGENGVTFFSVFGVTASFPFVIKTVSGDTEEKVNIIKDEQAIEYYLDIALSVGAGLSFELDNGAVFTELRYNHGLGNTIDLGDYDSKALRLSVGYLFYL